jgi:hypothetical protein
LTLTRNYAKHCEQTIGTEGKHAMSQAFSAAATTLVIQGGTLIDGTGRPPVENSAIVIQGDRFKAVGKNGALEIPPGSEIVDVTGKTVLPGYIDGHGHWEDWFGELYLHLGITTCVNIELYQDGPWILAQRDGTNSGKIRGPRLWASGQALGTREAEAVRESARAARGEISVSSADEARTAVRKKKQDGYDIIKVNEFVPLNWLEFVVKEANELGMPVTGHSWDAIGSASAGIGGIEHIWSVGYSSITDDQKRRRIGADRLLRKIDAEQVGAFYEVNHYDRIIGAMVEHGVAWTPTVAKWLWPLSSNAERFWARAQEILADPAATKYFPAAFPYTVAQTRNRFERYNPEQLDLAKLAHENSLEFIRRFVAAGGILKEGSDPPQGMAGLQMHIGMAMDVEAGVPPMTAIQAATLNAAKTFKKDKDFGSVEAGKVADLAIVEGDPLKDIWATQNVKIVVMNGKVVDIGFHADWTNPIPAALPGHSVPKETEISPVVVTQGSGSTLLKVKGKGMRPYLTVKLNGNDLETRFVRGELEAIIPAHAIENVGLYFVTVASPGTLGQQSYPAHLIVRFRD